MSDFIRLQQVLIDNGNISYESVVVNVEHIVCVEHDGIRKTSYPAVLNYLDVDKREYTKVIDEIETPLITLVSGKQIRVSEKMDDLQRLLLRGIKFSMTIYESEK